MKEFFTGKHISKEQTEEKDQRTIAELWMESEEIKAEIMANPLKYPVQYLHIIIFEGVLIK